MNKLIVVDGYIIATANTSFGADERADEVEAMLCHQPTAPSGYTYKLRADNLEWELVELPAVDPTDEEAGPEDYELALQQMGVDFSD